MPEYRPEKSGFIKKEVNGKMVTLLKKAELDRFTPSILGLGDLSNKSRRVEAMAAMFDLEGFTNFCKQIDPHLSVPSYLSQFLDWLMGELKKETINQDYPEGSNLWHPLPFFLKFMGDGLLILWDCETMHQVSIKNVIYSLHQICQNYESNLLKSLKNTVVDPPPTLRCGIARGTIFSVGDGSDYVGSCINMSARIQRLPGVRFAFNLRGVGIDDEDAAFFTDEIIVQKVSIRGIGENELICVLKRDLKKMDLGDRKYFRNP